jgi:DNA-binding NtrC family response regulator
MLLKQRIMAIDTKLKVFLIDDDSVFLKSLEIEFMQSEEFEVETYPTGELCVESLSHKPDVIILDYHLDGIIEGAMNGIDTLKKIKTLQPDIPVVMLSSQDKIDIAIDCMHAKALDYVIKSETAFIRLQKIIATISSTRKMEKELKWYMSKT